MAFIAQFAFIALVSSLVYHTLRSDDLRGAILLGARRFVSFFVVALGFGVCLQLFTRWL